MRCLVSKYATGGAERIIINDDRLTRKDSSGTTEITPDRASFSRRSLGCAGALIAHRLRHGWIASLTLAGAPVSVPSTECLPRTGLFSTLGTAGEIESAEGASESGAWQPRWYQLCRLGVKQPSASANSTERKSSDQSRYPW